MKIDLNEFKQEVHALAVEKGFYDPQPTDAELIAAIHGEISEAFEEWRAGRPMVYYDCGYSPESDPQPCIRMECPNWNDKDCQCYDCGTLPPEGIAAELIDVVLRVLGTAAAWRLELQESYWSSPDPYRYADQFYLTSRSNIAGYALPKLVCELHYLIDELYIMRMTRQDAQDIANKMSIPIYLIYTWLTIRDIDPGALMREKHEYNKTRPYKRGGKRV